jgi:putative transposase
MNRRSIYPAPLEIETTPLQPLDVIPQPKVVWAVDFMSDTLYGERRVRTLNLMDEEVREVLAIDVDTSLPAERAFGYWTKSPPGAASSRPFGSTMAWEGEGEAFTYVHGQEFVAAIRPRRRDCRIGERGAESE